MKELNQMLRTRNRFNDETFHSAIIANKNKRLANSRNKPKLSNRYRTRGTFTKDALENLAIRSLKPPTIVYFLLSRYLSSNLEQNVLSKKIKYLYRQGSSRKV